MSLLHSDLAVKMFPMLRGMLGAAALALPTMLATGCVATVQGHGGAAVVYDDEPTLEIATYPRYYYDGMYVYLVGDRWYYNSGGHWVYYRNEPPGLYRYRATYYSRYGYREPPRYGAPPAYRGRYVPPHAYRGPVDRRVEPRAYEHAGPGRYEPRTAGPARYGQPRARPEPRSVPRGEHRSERGREHGREH